MVVVLTVLILIAAALVICLIMPGFTDDINVGFYLLITGIFAISAFVVMLRKNIKFFRTLSWYILTFLIVFLIGEGVLIYFSNDDIPTGNEQVIIVAGGGLFVESRMTEELEKRIDLAIELYEKNPQLRVILSGGTDENRALPQSTAMKVYLEKKIREKGIEMPEIIIDDKSSGLDNNIKTSLNIIAEEIPHNVSAQPTTAYIIVSRHNVARTKLLDEYELMSPDSTVLGAEYPVSKYVLYYIREFGYTLKTVFSDIPTLIAVIMQATGN